MHNLDTTILILPRYGSPDFNDPLSKDTQLFTSVLSEKYKVLLPIPRDRTQVFFERMGRVPNVEYIPIDMMRSDFVEEGLITKELYEKFNQFDGSVAIDAVLNLRHINGLMFDRLFTVTSWVRGHHYKIPVPVIHTPYSQVRVKEIHKYGDFAFEIDSKIEVALYLSGKNFLFRSPSEIELVRREMLKVVRPTVVRDFVDSAVWMSGLDIERFNKELDAVRTKGSRDIDILYAGRTSPVKNIPWVADVMNQLYITDGMKCVLNSHKGESTATQDIKNKGYGIDLCLSQTYSQYLEKLSRTKIFFMAERKASFCFTMFEAIMAGCVAVIKKEFWLDGLMPSWYPFYVDTKEEAISLIRWAVNNLEEAQEKMKPTLRWIEEQYSLDVFHESVSRYFKQVMAKEYGAVFENVGSGSVIGLAMNAYEDGDSVYTLKEKVKQLTRSKQLIAPDVVFRLIIKWLRGDYKEEE